MAPSPSEDGTGHVRMEGFGEAASALPPYPDGSLIWPTKELPHGIEYKRGLMTNAKQ